MSAATVIRHQAIGNKIGMVISTSYAGRKSMVLEARFQLYMQSKAVDCLLQIDSRHWKTEAGAIEHFDNWVIEAQLEAA